MGFRKIQIEMYTKLDWTWQWRTVIIDSFGLCNLLGAEKLSKVIIINTRFDKLLSRHSSITVNIHPLEYIFCPFLWSLKLVYQGLGQSFFKINFFPSHFYLIGSHHFINRFNNSSHLPQVNPTIAINIIHTRKFESMKKLFIQQD